MPATGAGSVRIICCIFVAFHEQIIRCVCKTDFSLP